MKIVTAAEMREIDRITSEQYGVPALTLMENAGSAVAKYVLQNYSEAKQVGVVCGKGNNGGDGFVAARKLHEAGRKVKVLLLANPKELRGDAAAMYRKLPVKPTLARNVRQLREKAAQQVFTCELLIDAMLGTGFHPPLSGLLEAAITLFREQSQPIVAIDLPSGIDADSKGETLSGTHVPCSDVVTFTAAKPCLVLDALGYGSTVVVAPIGTPDEAIQSSLGLHVVTAQDAVQGVLPRLPNAHKGSYGHVLVIGGSVGKAGAAALAGMAALRAGAGLVTIAAPQSVQATIAGFAPELMTAALPETAAGTISTRVFEDGRLEKLLEGKTVLALGPGISTNAETADFVRTLMNNCRLPVVLDADGLNAFQGMAEKLNGRVLPRLVLTPHPGEMARLAGCTSDDVQRNRIGIARQFAQQHDAIVVLKGHKTVIAFPDGAVWINTTGNPAMAKGGSGDVLTGIVAAMLARDSFLPTLSAVYLHGLAGDIARERLDENSVLATDLIRYLPDAFRALRTRAREEFQRIQ
jgi:hydroxyethylthiazole kinase-like uncharacterized protein yjeF